MASRTTQSRQPPRTSLDWPLSKEEKRACVLRLYEKDVRAANHLLDSKESCLEALADEVRVLRRKSFDSVATTSAGASNSLHEVDDDFAEDVFKRLEEVNEEQEDEAPWKSSEPPAEETDVLMSAPNTNSMESGSGATYSANKGGSSPQAGEIQAGCNPQALLSFFACSMWQQRVPCVPRTPCVGKLPVPCVGPCACRPRQDGKFC